MNSYLWLLCKWSALLKLLQVFQPNILLDYLISFFNIQEAVIQPGSGHGTAGCHETSAEQKPGTKKWSRGNGTMLTAS